MLCPLCLRTAPFGLSGMGLGWPMREGGDTDMDGDSAAGEGEGDAAGAPPSTAGVSTCDGSSRRKRKGIHAAVLETVSSASSHLAGLETSFSHLPCRPHTPTHTPAISLANE